MATLFFEIKIKKNRKINYISMTIIKEKKLLKINIKLKFSLEVKLQPTFRVQNDLLCTKALRIGFVRTKEGLIKIW